MNCCHQVANALRALPVLVCLLSLGGCGSGSDHATAGSTGSVTFRIEWPASTRLIPRAAQSLDFHFWEKRSDTDFKEILTKVVDRPGAGGSSVLTVDLPSVLVVVDILARPEPDGTGTAQAEGHLEFRVPQSATLTQSVTLESTITDVAISPATAIVAPHSSLTLTATAKAGNSVVLVDPAAWQWDMQEPLSAGSLTGDSIQVNVGENLPEYMWVTVTDQESGKSALAELHPPDALAGHYTVAGQRRVWQQWGPSLNDATFVSQQSITISVEVSGDLGDGTRQVSFNGSVWTGRYYARRFFEFRPYGQGSEYVSLSIEEDGSGLSVERRRETGSTSYPYDIEIEDNWQ